MSNEAAVFYVPWPPTVNSYYAQTRPTRKYLKNKEILVPSARVISAKGRKFREKVVKSVNEQVPDVFFSEKIRVITILHPPDRRKRDLDNYIKALFDALTHAGLWEDDALIDQHENYRGEILKEGCVRVQITDPGPILPFDIWP